MIPRSDLDLDLDLDGCLPDGDGCDEFPGPGLSAVLVMVLMGAVAVATLASSSEFLNGMLIVALTFMACVFLFQAGRRHRRRR